MKMAPLRVAILWTVLGHDDENIRDMWSRVRALPSDPPGAFAALEDRVHAMRKFAADTEQGVRTHAHVDEMLDALGVADRNERERMHKKMGEVVYEEARGFVAKLEQDKVRHPARADAQFPRRFAEKNPWIAKDETFNETADFLLEAMSHQELFFEELKRRRPDLYRVTTWVLSAVAEAERLGVGMDAAKEERTSSEEVELTGRVLKLMAERDATRDDLEARGFLPGSDDFERVMNVFEARIRALMEIDE
jgi:hypothetical protein